MKETLILGVTVGAFALLGNVAGGYIIAQKLAGLAAPPGVTAGTSSAEIAIGRLRRDPSLRS